MIRSRLPVDTRGGGVRVGNWRPGITIFPGNIEIRRRWATSFQTYWESNKRFRLVIIPITVSPASTAAQLCSIFLIKKQ